MSKETLWRVGQTVSFLRYKRRTEDFFSFSFWHVQLDKLIEKNYYLHKSAQEAYKSYVRAYDSHSLKQIYSVNTLNLPMVALSFGFKVPPYVDLSILLRRYVVKLWTVRDVVQHFHAHRVPLLKRKPFGLTRNSSLLE